ncbi:hypothetical protein SDC9_193244 [bioreactor metagenome]|uniref:Uncharacterized protein n=1 Tax=bioreactor metagenome TaxID=1076179 RepID=A0A645I316_9ZZZZ
MGHQVIVQVECYSGSAYGERPQALIWKGRHVRVEEVLDTRQNPNGKAFTLLLAGAMQIELEYDQAKEVWTANGLT